MIVGTRCDIELTAMVRSSLLYLRSNGAGYGDVLVYVVLNIVLPDVDSVP